MFMKIYVLSIIVVSGVSVLVSNYTVGFLHMRKSGGTTFLRILTEWMQQNECFRNEEERITTRGMREGIAFTEWLAGPINGTAPCPHVDIQHQEIRFLNGRELLNFVPRRKRAELGLNFSLFTALRDPVDRIISQSMYGDSNIVEPILNQTLWKNCEAKMLELTTWETYYHVCRQFPKDNYPRDCECFFSSWTVVLNILKSNTTIWRNWITAERTHGDSYIPNYYVRRLTSFSGPDGISDQIRRINECMLRPKTCTADLNRYSILSTLLEGSMDPSVLYDILPPDALEVSKRLLKEQFDFILIDKLNKPCGQKAIELALFGTMKMHPQPIVNGGLLKNLKGVRYSLEVLPPSILQQLLRENHLDVQLYDYANRLFEERMPASRSHIRDRSKV